MRFGWTEICHYKINIRGSFQWSGQDPNIFCFIEEVFWADWAIWLWKNDYFRNTVSSAALIMISTVLKRELTMFRMLFFLIWRFYRYYELYHQVRYSLFHQLWFSMGHHERFTIDAPSHSEPCFCLELRLRWARSSHYGSSKWLWFVGCKPNMLPHYAFHSSV